MKVKKAMAAAAIILLTAAQTMTAQATTQDTSWTFVIDTSIQIQQYGVKIIRHQPIYV